MSDFTQGAGKGGGPTPFVNAFSGPSINSLRYNTSQAGSPIPLCYGTQRLTVNLIEGFGFSHSGGGKGGKGLGGSGGKKGGVNYSVNVAFALCQGPVGFTGAPGGFLNGSTLENRVWSNGGIAGINKVGLNTYAGTDGQAADPVFLSSDPDSPVIGYSGTAYVTGTPMQLGSSPALPNIQFEVTGFEVGTAGPDFPGDANPSDIIGDMLTNPRYGAGFPAANLDLYGSLTDYATYCQAASLAMSMVLDRVQPAARWLEEIAQLTVAAVVWSGAMLKIIPYAEGAVSGNGTSWTPNLTAQYSLTDSDFIDFGGGSDPVVCTRQDPAQMTNWLSLEYMDSGNSYNPTVMPTWDQGLIDLYGERSEPPVQAHGFTNGTAAWNAAMRLLQRKAYVRNTYTFKLGFRHSLLEPMDIVALDDATLGLAGALVRITRIDEDDNGELTVTAEELLGGSAAATVTRQVSAGAPIDYLADPGNTNPPVIFEPPATLTNGVPEIWIIATGGPQWGGCQVWISTDGNTYGMLGTIVAGARQGSLTAPLPSHSDPDTADTLSVDLSISEGQLLSGTQADADGLVTLCYVGGELVSYETATLTSAYTYNLNYLRRGAYGTAIGSHAAGTQFARFGPNDPSVLQYPFPASYIGRTLYVKLPAFNTFGQALQSLADVAPTTFTLLGSGVDTANNPVIAALEAGSAQDWGIIGSAVSQSADLGPITLAPGVTIDLGIV